MYIVWSLVMAGDRSVDKEIEALVVQSKEGEYSKDAYFIGLLSATLFEVRITVAEETTITAATVDYKC